LNFIQAQTVFGFNQTHLTNSLTNNKGEVIWSNVEKIRSDIPKDKLQCIRWPGGTVANEYSIYIYGHTLSEAKSSKWQRLKLNPIKPFIEISKKVGWEVIPVLNLTDVYEGTISYDKGLSQSIEMIEMFLVNGIPIKWIELGNELNIWTGVTGDYNRNQKKYDEAINRYYELSLKFFNDLSKRYPGIQIAAVSARSGMNGRDNKWSSIFDKGPWHGIVIHHYEDNSSPKIWQLNIEQMVAQAKAAKKKLLITELNVRLGPNPNSAAYKKNAGQSWISLYQEACWQICKNAGVDVVCYHRISGTDEHDYNYIEFSRSWENQINIGKKYSRKLQSVSDQMQLSLLKAS
jgi:hypothetical protein